MTTIAFIGLGIMGGPMSVHLANAGYDDAAIDALFSHRITQDGTH